MNEAELERLEVISKRRQALERYRYADPMERVRICRVEIDPLNARLVDLNRRLGK
jgi:hypothetical protein